MGIRLTSRRALTGYAVWMALLVAAHYALAGQRTGTEALIGVSGVAAMVAGVAMNRPARRMPWLLLAAANLSGTLAAVAAREFVTVSHAPLPFPSFADVIYLAAYPLYVAGLAMFVRSRSAGRDARSLIDALVLMVGLIVLGLIFLVVPDATAATLTWTQRVVSVAYPVGDLLVLVTLARLLTPGTARGPSTVLLAIGTVGGVASDVAYDLVADSGHRAMAVLSLGYLVSAIAWGAAALHPSMVELTDTVRRRIPDAAPGSVIVLMLASLIPPVYLLVHSIQQHDRVEGVIAIACGVLYLLMLFRLWDVAATNRRTLIRERTLRVASAALASAGSVEEVAAAVRAAASGLLPDVPPDRVAILAVREGDRLREIDPSGPSRPVHPPDPVGVWLTLAEGRTSRFVSVAEIRTARHGSVPPAPASQARAPESPAGVGYEGALICPLTLKDRPAGDPFIGLAGFFGDRRPLDDLTTMLEILAGQAALAVERLALTQEVARQRGEALFRTLVQDASDVILIVGDDRRIRYATPSVTDIFGDVAVEGALLTELVAAGARDDVDRVLDLMLALSAGGNAGTRVVSPGYLLQIERLDGHMAVIEVRWSDLRHDPTVGGLVLTLRDVTEQHQLEEELKYRAFHDSLTGLPNRSLFAREAADALETARAVGRVAGVLFVDLDDFKIVNDTMGHSVGDELLVAVAARLAASVRASDTAARLGGDEFALLIDDAADPDDVDAFGERIVAAFGEPFTLSEAKVIATATVGVATSEDSDDVDELLRHADLALYAAKTAGKRRWRHYQPVLTSGMLRRREIQVALEDAVKSSGFTLAYQPIVALSSGEISGFESLIRWPHPRWGMMLPGQFISLAEETGLIVPLGAWVLRQALADMVRWRRDLPPPATLETGAPLYDTEAYDTVRESGGPHVSVNVSARQFRDPGFVDSVRQALHASALPPSALLLELTESLVLGGNDQIRADLNELKEIGVRLAIDDFGTGYSSLSYLLDLPIDVLKIDKAFVTGIASSWRRHALVEGIVRLARTLEVEVIAEGIETETERELLAGMGCQFGQGYLLSVPVDADLASAMLRRGAGLVTELPQQPRRTQDGRYLTDL
jgi:diguanylate cyclase (GGDEF)-like protein/PAS domain S-box-containing protein